SLLWLSCVWVAVVLGDGRSPHAAARLYLYPVTRARVRHGKQDHQIVSAGKQHWFLTHQDLSCALHEVRRPYFPNLLGIRPFHSHACCTAVLSCTSTDAGFPPPRPQTQAWRLSTWMWV
ncbi:hypothetical protein JB92DRAFT_3037667, partial [Gautieria morchelliformis]